ncbi:MAG: ATP-binding protein [Candidatus Nezhaarchaeota archaeon]|nr:ATP-binding protein [Candidatus Nezhaarchaeota archaeon]
MVEHDAKLRGTCGHCHEMAELVRLNYAKLSLCESCFLKFVERKVDRTIKAYKMVKRDDVLLLALSGGKDSSALLHILRVVAPEVKIMCLHVDLGIPSFSQECRKRAEEMARREGVELTIMDLGEFLGCTISDIAFLSDYRRRICSVCGLAKRYIMNYVGSTRGATKIVTGHNLDDVTAILWDFYMTGELLEAVKIQPVTQPLHVKSLPRIKPLIELTDFEIKTYADLKGLPYASAQCSLGRESKLNRRKKLMNIIESSRPGFKHTLLKSHVKRVTPLISKVRLASEPYSWTSCARCGMPSLRDLCRMCRLKDELQLKLKV